MTPVRVFCAYASADEPYRKQLEKLMVPLRRDRKAEYFDGSMIPPGVQWERKLFEKLDASRVVLLLVSPDFLASSYAYEVEMKRALARRDARVVPILIRPCDWKQSPELAQLQVLPQGADPISTWEREDDAWLNVLVGIKHVLDEVRSERETETIPDPSSPAPPAERIFPGVRPGLLAASDRAFYAALGPEQPGHRCQTDGCDRGRVPHSSLCRVHSFEAIKGRPSPFFD